MSDNGTVVDAPLVNAYVVGVGFDDPGVVNASGATAGTPGTFTPAGSEVPANLAAMSGVTASPATAWTVGQYVQTRTSGAAGQCYWNGTAWTGGKAPAVGGE